LKKEQMFGVKQRRFEAKLDLKEYFNKEPGPGTYENHKFVEDVYRQEA
jgi:hypothetical protein